MGHYHILSFDGGPSGMTYLRCLAELERRNPGLATRAHMLAGTSYGSVIALFLARHLPPRDSGASALDAIEGCIRFMDEVVDAVSPDLAAWGRLVVGKEAMVDTVALSDVLARDENLGAGTTLGDVSRDVVVVTTLMREPWAPVVYRNFGPVAHRDEPLVELVLRSSAFPLTLPTQKSHVDGAMYANNPALCAVTEALSTLAGARARAAGLERMVLLTLGGDDGSSWGSAQSVPGERASPVQAVEALVDRVLGHASVDPGDPGTGGILGEIRAHAGKVHETWEGLHTAGFFEQRFGFQLRDDRSADALGEDVAEDTPEADNWGWRYWLAWAGNPLYLLQVWIDSAGRGVTGQCEQLLGDRAFRLAPVGTMTTSKQFILLMLGFGDLVQLEGRLVSSLWNHPILGALCGFDPDVRAAESWIRGTWMALDADEAAVAGARRDAGAQVRGNGATAEYAASDGPGAPDFIDGVLARLPFGDRLGRWVPPAARDLVRKLL